jgi:hypothetical protein
VFKLARDEVGDAGTGTEYRDGTGMGRLRGIDGCDDVETGLESKLKTVIASRDVSGYERPSMGRI